MALPPLDAPYTLGAQIEARGSNPAWKDRVLVRHDGRRWTYGQYRDECVRLAHFLARRLGPVVERRPGHVAMILENHPELLDRVLSVDRRRLGFVENSLQEGSVRLPRRNDDPPGEAIERDRLLFGRKAPYRPLGASDQLFAVADVLHAGGHQQRNQADAEVGKR